MAGQDVNVRVSPDLTGFRSKLNAAIKSASPNVKVGLTPNMAGFQAKLNAEAKARDLKVKVRIEPDFTGFGAALRSAMAANANEFRGAGDEAGRRFGDGFTNGANNTIQGNGLNTNGLGGNGAGNNNGLNNQASSANRLNAALTRVARTARQAGQGLFRLGLANVLAASIAGAIQLAAALAPVVNILLAIPGAVSVAGSALATLLTGFSGIGAALGATNKAVGGVGAAASDAINKQRAVEAAIKEVAQSERDLIAANRDLENSQYLVGEAVRQLDDAYQSVIDAFRDSQKATNDIAKAQKALSEARREAERSLESYARRLRGAAIDEESATVALAEAQKEYDRLVGNGVTNQTKLRKARLEVEQAELNVANAIQSNIELQQEASEAQAKGVAGADSVTSAQEQLSQAYLDAEAAQRKVADANHDVELAQRGVVESQNDVADANQRVIDAQDAIVEANQRVADAQREQAEQAAKSAGAIDKAAEAFNRLSPSAKALVLAIKAVGPEFRALQQSVQENLFKDVDVAFTNLANNSLPTLQRGLGGIATAFNELFIGSLKAASTPFFQGNLTKIFEATERIVRSFGEALPPLILGLSNLSVAALPVIERFTDFVSEGLKAFGENAQTQEGVAKFTEKLDKAAERISQLYQILKNVGSIIGSVFKASGPDEFIGKVQEATSNVAEFFKSAEGQEDLKNVFEALSETGEAVGRVLKFVAEIVATLAGAFNRLPEPVQDFLSTAGVIGIVVGPILIIFGGLATAVLSIGTALGVVATAIGVSIGVFVALGAAAAGAAAFILRYWDEISAASALLRQKIKEAFNGIKEEIVSKFTGVTEAIQLAFTDPKAFMNEYGYDIIRGLLSGLTFGLSDVVLFFLTKLPESIKQPFKDALGINSPSTVFEEFGRNVIQGLLNGFSALLGNVSSAIGSVAGTVTGGFNGLVSNVTAKVGELALGVGSRVGETLTHFTELPGKILTAFGNVGSFLYLTGRNLIQGLLDGMGSLLKTIGTFMADKLPQAIQGPFKKALGIASPSKVFTEYGKNIVEGLTIGIDDERQASIDAAMARLTSELVLGPTTLATSLVSNGAPAVTAAAPYTSGRIVNQNISQNFYDSSPTDPYTELRKAERLAAPIGGL